MSSGPPPTLAARALLPLAMASTLAALFVYRRAGSPSLAPPKPTPLSSGPIEARAVAAPVDSTPMRMDALAPTTVRAARYEYELAVGHTRAPSAAALTKLRATLTAAGFAVSGAPARKPGEARSVELTLLVPGPDELLPKSFACSGGDTAFDEASWELVRKPARLTKLVFRGPGETALADYRAALGALAELETNASGYLFDRSSFEVFSRAGWAKRLEGWDRDVPVVDDHFVIEWSTSQPDTKLLTRGLAKLALPDIAIERLSHADRAPMQEVLRVLAQTLVERPQLPTPGKLTLDLRALRHPAAKARHLEKRDNSLAMEVTLTEPPPDAQDPENHVLELAFPGAVGTLHERHGKLLAGLLPITEQMVEIDNEDPALQRAIALARAEAIALKPRVAAGLPSEESLHLKLPFEGPEGTENMWVDVQSWEGPRIEGILLNTPLAIPGLKLGSRVVVQESAIRDYVFGHADGSVSGDLTKPFGKPAPSR